jgi:benzoate-CoA ligase
MATEKHFNLYDYFFPDKYAADDWSKTAIEFHDSRITYTDLKLEVANRMSDFMALGVNSGDRVALLLYDSPEFIYRFLATISLGAISVPINTFLNSEEIDFIIQDSGARLLITDKALAKKLKRSGSDNEMVKIFVFDDLERVEKIGGADFQADFQTDFQADADAAKVLTSRPACADSENALADADAAKVLPHTNKDSAALLLYTSGSTGTPKGALHSLGNIAAVIEGFGRKVLQLNSSDRVFSASRLYFAYGLGNSLTFPLAAKASVILTSERPTAAIIARIFENQRPTVFFGVPAVFRALLDMHLNGSRLDTSSLRMCVSAGEALPATIFEEWQKVFGQTILDGIGSTEMLHMFISNQQEEAKAGSSGKVVEGYEARILDDIGNAVAVGEQGHLWIKGNSAMLGYWNRQDLTANVLRDGWMRTGDVYRQDAEGYYFHLGRSDDCFKVKGLWVSPVEIEAVLIQHPEVQEAAVVASLDENDLATAKAYLVIRNISATLKEEIFEFAKARLTLYKTPTQYEFVEEMPRTSTGKIQRFKLRS